MASLLSVNFQEPHAPKRLGKLYSMCITLEEYYRVAKNYRDWVATSKSVKKKSKIGNESVSVYGYDSVKIDTCILEGIEETWGNENN